MWQFDGQWLMIKVQDSAEAGSAVAPLKPRPVKLIRSPTAHVTVESGVSMIACRFGFVAVIVLVVAPVALRASVTSRPTFTDAGDG